MGRPSSCKSTASLLLCVAVSFLAELVLVHGGLVPALYVLGDSQADVGNNNHLQLSPLRANFPRNGIDYPGQQATGRFSNGHNFVDFLAGSLGLASPPAYHSIRDTAGSNSTYLDGINFASGGAGVCDLTNKGQCFSFDHQIECDYSSVHSELVRQLGQPQATDHLSKSIFVVAIGGNDIIFRALPRPAVDLTAEVLAVISLPPQEFIDSLAQTLRRQLQRLYDLGMRRLFFVGAAPIGCVPLMRELSLSRRLTTAGGCHDGANDMSARYNAAVRSLLGDMSTQHQDLQYAFFDTYTTLMQHIKEPEANGYAEVKAACCGLGDNNAMYRCGRVSTVCPNRTNHMFWDLVHPTETTSRRLTGIAFDGSSPLVSPINVRTLVSQER
ncbi:hypothetical protein BDA96_01G191400 [Sorghum bicolor]|uniref:GDSL esterase/lipase n=1 Tax=Sorghum bicolor TaxID=4558 RepID=A0A921RZQ8_SORBI|nr:hypothetical protein BDA96_01G191400 [Sorghum bicolor]